MNTRQLSSSKARAMAAARKTRSGGRSAPTMACAWCGEPQTARSMRTHFTSCPKRPKTETDIRHEQNMAAFNSRSIDQLIAEQHIQPIADISVLSGAIPDEDVDEFVADIYRDRKR